MEEAFVENISLEGFQVVRGRYFAHYMEPTMAIRQNNISFNTPARAILQHCENVRILLNDKTKRILVDSSSSNEPDAVRWVKQDDKKKYDPIECTAFVKNLREAWKLDPKCNYRLVGRPVTCNRKIMLLFDMATAEKYPCKKKEATGER